MLNKKLKIMSLIAVIIFLVSTLAVSTYAWFTINQSVKTSNIEVRASASQEINISADAQKWKNSITLYDIMNASYFENRLNQIPNNFQAYSTVGNLNDGMMDMFHGLVKMEKDVDSPNYGKLVLTSEKISEVDGVTGGFLAFDLYLKNNITTNLYLGKKSYVDYVSQDTGIENAIRIAFVFEGSLPSYSNAKDIQALKTNDASNVIIWEANSNKHTSNAVENAKKMYGIDISEDYENLEYYGIKKEFSTPQLLTSTSEEYFGLMKNNICTKSDYSTSDTLNHHLFMLPEGISKIRVYAWVEGQDIDCENNAAGSDFKFNFNFTTKNKES